MQQQQPPPAAYQPPPPGYGAPPPGQQSTVIVQGGPMIVTPIFRDIPVAMTCPYCHASITTSTRFESGTLTWIICGVLILFGLWLGCCLIPFCIDGCKDCVHSCPNCNQVVGKFNRM